MPRLNRPLFFGLGEYRGRLPTTDLYFLNPLARLIRLDAGLPRVAWVGANTFAAGTVGVVSRYGSPRDLDLLAARGVRRIVYIADDDFEAGAADSNLPDAYRAKLDAFAKGAWPMLKQAADVVLVPSPALAAIYGRKARIIDPAWSRPPAGSRHFEAPRRIDIVHLGTGSHRADLAPIAPVLAELLAAHPNVRLTLFAGADAPAELRAHPQVRSRRPAPWWRYKHTVPWLRFHLAIYPLQASRFNAARSSNKLFEQALTGAAPLMSPNPALREAAGAALADIFVEGGPEQWRERLRQDVEQVEALRGRAERTAAQIRSSDPLERAAAVWRPILAEA